MVSSALLKDIIHKNQSIYGFSVTSNALSKSCNYEDRIGRIDPPKEAVVHVKLLWDINIFRSYRTDGIEPGGPEGPHLAASDGRQARSCASARFLRQKK